MSEFKQTIFDPSENSPTRTTPHCFKCGKDKVVLIRQNKDPSFRGFVYGVFACEEHDTTGFSKQNRSLMEVAHQLESIKSPATDDELGDIAQAIAENVLSDPTKN